VFVLVNKELSPLIPLRLQMVVNTNHDDKRILIVVTWFPAIVKPNLSW
jgi:hypothetical protein